MNDLKFAFRQLLKNPGFTAVAVLTLAIPPGSNRGMHRKHSQSHRYALDWLVLESSKLTLDTCPVSTRFQ